MGLKKITPNEAAELMGCSPMYVRCGLRCGRLTFGTAMQLKKAGRWTYNIVPAKLAADRGISLEELTQQVEEIRRRA